ncbi:MAG: radical SAM protein [Candidatus Omnitrophica bacterium]|nr:radical SAM protein [Candidatus Omnitrophota bacterium]
MKKSEFKYIFGPVYSWRLGMSLGIDPLSMPEKTCNFNCVYCQLGETKKYSHERAEFVPVKDIVKEVKSLPPMNIDYYTFSGRGEPTLAKNLGAMIKAVREVTGGKIAVITNASLIDDKDVQKDLLLADFVLAKLDTCGEHSLNVVNRPAGDIRFQRIVDGIKAFKKTHQGKLALQIMFVGHNKDYAQAIADIAEGINPDEIQINTPLRPCQTAPLSEEEILKIKKHFKSSSVITVYEADRRDVEPLDEKNTLLRHGNAAKQAGFD